ncbi:uncharacterized protein LOC120286135 [Eucalyptus grandis]|uniref:uncharacterized protein LOC120286135 n=1 Tax=Eucalyptus grandis TaxID=71139 RepID=UPI00192EF467|nr:uncharacterized protein LOC120286135 [Eucalyptus grandis]
MRPCCSALVLAIAHQIASIPTTCQSQNFKNLGRDLEKGSALENLFFKANQGTWTFSPREDVLKMEKKRRLFPFKFIHKKGINLLKFIFFLKTFSSERYAIHVTVEQEGVLRYMVEKMGEELSREDGTEREIIITGEDSQPERESEAKQEEGHPHEHQSILGTTDVPPPIHDQLSAGVFLSNRTMKHWVEKESKKNCFMIYARGLSITWAKNNSYWQWLTQKDAPS